MIGLSLSLCIRDIAEGKVDEADVEEIIASTSFTTLEEWQKVLDDYTVFYWYKNPELCRTIANRLRTVMKIDQPRRRNDPCPDIRTGHWVAKREQIVWRKPLWD